MVSYLKFPTEIMFPYSCDIPTIPPRMTKLAAALALLAFATAQEEPKPKVNIPSINFAPSGWSNCQWISSGGPSEEKCYETRWTDGQGEQHIYLAAKINYPPGGTSCQGMFIIRLD